MQQNLVFRYFDFYILYFTFDFYIRDKSQCYVWQRKFIFSRISKLRTQCTFKNIKMKAYTAMKPHNLKVLYTETCSKIFQDFEKSLSIPKGASVIKKIFNKM